MRTFNLNVSYPKHGKYAVISPKQGKTVFTCGCWVKMDYARRTNDIVGGHLCNEHYLFAYERYGLGDYIGEDPMTQAEVVTALIEEGFLIKGANVS